MRFCEFDEESGCMLWQGRINSYGHAQFRGVGNTGPAHRWIFQYFYGKVKRKLKIRHKDICQYLHCVNPEHLKAVTHKESVQGRKKPQSIKPKTHCLRDHEFDEENTYHRPDGRGRDCIKCMRIRARNSRAIT